MNTTNPLDFARPLDIWCYSTLPEIKQSADYIFGLLEKNDADCKNASAKQKLRIKDHLKLILTDLFMVMLENSQKYIAFHRNKNKYLASKRFSKIFLNHKYVIMITDFLSEQDYIELHKGVHTKLFKRMSRMRAADRLKSAFKYFRQKARKVGNTHGVITRRDFGFEMRDSKKRRIEFDAHDPKIKTIIQKTNKINKLLSRHCVDKGEIPDEILFSQRIAIVPKYMRYTRIFNNSSINEGGRFYSHWTQQLPSKWRSYLIINGNETVELDYSCLHLRMLYAIKGITPSADDLYVLDGISEGFRDLVKLAVVIILNAKTEATAKKAIRKEINKNFNNIKNVPSPDELLNAIKSTHPLIQSDFCSNIGVKLQANDSELAQNIMLDLLIQGKPVLCVHDSFITEVQYKDDLYNKMREVFYNKFQCCPKIK